MAGYGFGDFFREYLLRQQPPNALARPMTEEEAWALHEKELEEKALAEEMARQQAMAQRGRPQDQAFDMLRRRQQAQQMLGAYNE